MDICSIHDDKLFEILKECRNLPNFLNAVFGFLNRRTDFYYVAAEHNSPVGLPKGVAEQCVKEIFFKWRPLNRDVIGEDAVPHVEEEVTIENTDENTDRSTIEDKSNLQAEVSLTANFTSSESYNGAVFENYSWSQTITEIDIIVKVQQNVTSKHLIIEILPQKITVKLKSGDVLLDGNLCEKVKHNDAIWSLDKHKLEIHLEKVAELWWNCLVTQEPKIDVNKIDCSRPFEELSADAQAKIEELTWNQERKRLGLPTSDELVFQNKLKNAWNAEGSPFKGPFDPSTVVFDH